MAHLMKATKEVTVIDVQTWSCSLDNRIHVEIKAYATTNFIVNPELYRVLITAYVKGSENLGVEFVYKTTDEDTWLKAYKHFKTYIYDKIPDNVDVSWFLDRGFVWRNWK